MCTVLKKYEHLVNLVKMGLCVKKMSPLRTFLVIPKPQEICLSKNVRVLIKKILYCSQINCCEFITGLLKPYRCIELYFLKL